MTNMPTRLQATPKSDAPGQRDHPLPRTRPPFWIERPELAADFDAVRVLFAAYAKGIGVDLGFQDFPAELAALPGPYAPPAGLLLLARGQGGQPLGCAGLRPLAPAGCCEMKRLYVAPAGRGMGIGAALVDAIIKEATRIGHRTLYLDTLPGMTAALRLYRAAGFTPTAPYYDTPLPGTVFLARTLGDV